MSIPTNILSLVKDLCFISNTERDTDIGTIYTRELNKVCLEEGWLVETESIVTVSGQEIYSTQTRCSRVIELLYNSVHLKRTTPDSIEGAYGNSWMGDATGTPAVWWSNKIPPSLDSLTAITPDNFIVHPSPNTSVPTFVAFEVCVPSSEDPTPTWIDPYLTYKVASCVLREFGEVREGEEFAQVSTQLIDFYEGISDLWASLLRERIL